MRRDKSTSQTVSTSLANAPSVLYEDNHLLGIFKPEDWQSQPSDSPAPDALSWAKAYLKEKYQKPGNVFLGLVHRLDRPVSGALVFARTSKAASRLSESFRTRAVEKRYLAWVEGKFPPGVKHMRAYLTKKAEPKVFVRQEAGEEWVLAEMSVQLREQSVDRALIEIELGTGRKHQIRALLADAGNPILGDTLYGSASGGRSVEIALMAQKLVFAHPTQEKNVEIVADPAAWMEKWRRFQM